MVIEFQLVYTFNTPKKKFGLFYAHVYLKLSPHDAVGVI